jgi:hypothetical protein
MPHRFANGYGGDANEGLFIMQTTTFKITQDAHPDPMTDDRAFQGKIAGTGPLNFEEPEERYWSPSDLRELLLRTRLSVN